jgi:hypothetical protein
MKDQRLIADVLPGRVGGNHTQTALRTSVAARYETDIVAALPKMVGKPDGEWRLARAAHCQIANDDYRPADSMRPYPASLIGLAAHRDRGAVKPGEGLQDEDPGRFAVPEP